MKSAIDRIGRAIAAVFVLAFGIGAYQAWSSGSAVAAAILGGLMLMILLSGAVFRIGFIHRLQARRAARRWAKTILADPHSYAIVDTETTGLGDDDEVIEVAAIDPFGVTLFNGRVRPAKRDRMPGEAQAIHGIGMADLEGKPTWAEQCEAVARAVGGRIIISYNAEYDHRLVRQTARRNGGYPIGKRWECAMLKYADYVGEWDARRRSYRWHKLDGGDHSALGDCTATLKVIRRMTEGQ